MPRADVTQGLIKPALDENLPDVWDLTFNEWNYKYRQLSTGDTMRDRDVFALTGHYKVAGTTYRAGLKDEDCRLPQTGMTVYQECDIDSVLGVVKGEFPIRPEATFKYFMLPSIKHTLNANLHIPAVSVPDRFEDNQLVPIHKIPNTRFGQIGDSFLVRVFFPKLPADDRYPGEPNYVNEGYLKLFYDLAVRPATTEILPQGLRLTWPAVYDCEMFRAGLNQEGDGGRGGQPQHSAREVHGHLLNDWVNKIRECVVGDNKLSFAFGFFFLVEAKGLKHLTQSTHLPPERPLVDDEGRLLDENNERTAAVEAILHDFDTARIPNDRWFVDIATTFSAEQEDEGGDSVPVCLLPNSDAHTEMIQHFTSKPIDRCEAWVNSSTGGYQRDELAHTGVFSGFRIDLEDPDDEEDPVHYLQVYTSDKSLTYHLDGSQKAKRTSPHRVLKDWTTERTKHFIPMQKAFVNASATHSVAVRVESRVAFEFYTEVHLFVPPRQFRPWLSFLPNTDFWGYKSNRLMAINNVLNEISKNRLKLVSYYLPEVASLIALLVWMANALVNRPDSGGNWDEVRDAGCVHRMENGQFTPWRPLKIFYLHSLYWSGGVAKVARISSHRTISRDTLLYLFGHTKVRLDDNNLLELIQNSGSGSGEDEAKPGDAWGVEPPEPTLFNRVGAKGNRQRLVTARATGDIPDAFAETIPQPPAPERYSSEDEDVEEREEAITLSQQASNIVYTYPIQIFAKAPNRRGIDESWCTLDSTARCEVNFDTFRDKEIPGTIFVAYMSFGRNMERWDNTIKAYFPTYSERRNMRPVQGLFQMDAFHKWDSLLRQTPADLRDGVVDRVRQHVNREWRWLPSMSKGHLWPTGAYSAARQVGPLKGGPWIVFNPRFRD